MSIYIYVCVCVLYTVQTRIRVDRYKPLLIRSSLAHTSSLPSSLLPLQPQLAALISKGRLIDLFLAFALLALLVGSSIDCYFSASLHRRLCRISFPTVHAAFNRLSVACRWIRGQPSAGSWNAMQAGRLSVCEVFFVADVDVVVVWIPNDWLTVYWMSGWMSGTTDGDGAWKLHACRSRARWNFIDQTLQESRWWRASHTIRLDQTKPLIIGKPGISFL